MCRTATGASPTGTARCPPCPPASPCIAAKPITAPRPRFCVPRSATGARICGCCSATMTAIIGAAGLLACADRHPDRAVALAGWDIAGLATRSSFATPRHRRRSRTWDMAYRAARLKQVLSGQARTPLSRKPPRRIIAQAGFADVFEGYGGVVVRPDFFDDLVFDIPAQAFHVDDVWLSGALARSGIGIWLTADQYEPKTTEADRHEALYRHRVAEQGRIELDAAAITLMRTRWNIWGGSGQAIPEGGARQV